MHIQCLGLNHNSAPASIREKFAVTLDALNCALVSLMQQDRVQEAVILSTCNRTEIYCVFSKPNRQTISQWLCEFHQLDKENVLPYLYHHNDQAAIQHAFRVASGLNSMVLGESQISGQMKTAFSIAHKNGHTGKILNRLFQHTFSVAKQIRSSTSIGNHALSVAYTAVALAKQIFSDISKQSVLFIGAGETIELACQHVHAQQVKKMVIANRTLQRAKDLANRYKASAITLAQLPDHIAQADIIFTSTASTLPILGKGLLESALKARKNRPIFIIDLAIPRDVEEQVGDLSNIYLYTLDDLQQVVDSNLQSRKNAAVKAEKIITEKVSDFLLWFTSLYTVPVVKALRKRTHDLINHELLLAKKRLVAGENPDKVLTLFAHATTQKFLHHPSETLRKHPDDNLALAAKELFQLNKHSK